jgi:DNA-directed RNA polymerase subunit M/transcription elongation factor TFIIS
MYDKEAYERNKSSILVCQKKWYQEHKEEQDTYRLAWTKEDRKTNPDKYWVYDFDKHWKPYGIDHHWYLEQFEKQNGLCAICGEPETAFDTKQGRRRRLAVDHNHLTREIRGLLCGRCNKILFILELIPDWFQRALNYLQKYNRM